MLQFAVRRFGLMVMTLVIVSMISFIVIELPPGDYITSHAAALRASGDSVDEAELDALRHQLGLDLPFHLRYLHWISNIVLRGNFGYSFAWSKPVSEIIWNRLGMTVMITTTSLITSE